MTDQEKIRFKNKLKQVCGAIIEQRIDAAKRAINDAQEAANNEEKSSAGDKYETSRAMNHLDKDMHSRRLAENAKELVRLHSIDVGIIYNTGGPGAFIQCADISFFIAAGLGKQLVEDEYIFFLSPNAPLSRLLVEKAKGQSFIFKEAPILILDIY